MGNMGDKEKNCFAEILKRRVSRRSLLKHSCALYSTSLVTSCSLSVFDSDDDSLTFKEVPQGLDEYLSLPEGYEYQVVAAWGDPLFDTESIFQVDQQTEESQLQQFGFNNDYVGFLPLPPTKEGLERGLLAVNHEHTTARLMFPGTRGNLSLDLEQTKVDIAAHGLSIIEISLNEGHWSIARKSAYNRRITPNTPMEITGPAAGHPRMKTNYSEDGIETLGTYGNCAGGITPWGTVLTAEENVDEYFTGDPKLTAEKANYQRFNYKGKVKKPWSRHFERWDLNKNPNEMLHVGWIVEIDPFDPQAKPKKRTSLGRCKHEGCNVHINSDGRVVAYSGDDEKFEYIYRFVSDKKFRSEQSSSARQHNMSLLDSGTLSVAKFGDDGRLVWLPLVFGQGPLTEKNGFASQADVVIDLRKAADLLEATPMDRPEDIEVNPVNNKVYVMLTKNSKRDHKTVNKANPRVNNRAGQIVELIAPEGDHTADVFNWEMLLLCGDPQKEITNYHPQTTGSGWLACPDNCAFDNQGNLWVATDGAEDFGVADGLWSVNLESPLKGRSKRFLRTPIGAELCGPFFTPDNRFLFCAVQHPAKGSSVDNPSTRWPDFDSELPPRPAVVAIRKSDGGIIGS